MGRVLLAVLGCTLLVGTSVSAQGPYDRQECGIPGLVTEEYCGPAPCEAGAVIPPPAAQVFTDNPEPDEAIPDNGGLATPLLRSLVVAGGPASIADLDVALDIAHTWYGDVRVELTHTGTLTSVVLLNNATPDDSSDLDGVYTLDDEAATTLDAAAVAAGVLIPPGNYRADNLLSAFDGMSSNTTWELRVSDHFGSDLGTLRAWSLLITPPAGANIGHLLPPLVSTMTVGCPGGISDLNVTLDIAHTWYGDVSATLQHVASATTVVLLTPGTPDDGSDLAGVYVLDDEAATTFDAAAMAAGAVIPPGTYRPDNLLSAFDGLSMASDWTLTMSDTVSGDNGTLTSWGLTITGAPGVISNVAPPVVQTITVADSFTIGDVDVELDISHTWLGDVSASLTHVGTATTMLLMNGTGGNKDLAGVYLLDDEAAGLLSAAPGPVIAPGSYRPAELLSIFDGLTSSSDWTISLSDGAGGDDGLFFGWCLILTSAGGVDFGLPVTPVISVSHVLDVTNIGIIQDLDVSFTLDHAWYGDLDLFLTGPTGITVTLLETPVGFGDSSNLSGTYTIDDEALTTFDDAAVAAPGDADIIPPGSYIGDNLLSAFDGTQKLGPWTLNFQDNVSPDSGFWSDWCLHIDQDDIRSECFEAGVVEPAVCSMPLDPNIPDNLPLTPLVDTLSTTLAAAISDVDVSLALTHTWYADLRVQLTHDVSLTTVVILNNGAGGSSDLAGVYVIDDEAAITLDAASVAAGGGVNVIPPGSYAPDAALSAFDGLTGTSTWTVAASDHAGGDLGTLTEWCVVLSWLDAPAISNVLPTVASTLTFVDHIVTTDVDVDVEIVHTWVGDIVLDLESPAGTLVRLHNGLGGSADNLFATFDDSGAPNAAPYNTFTRMQPSGDGAGPLGDVLADFNGEDQFGDWTLHASDIASGDDGLLLSWCLHLSGRTSACTPVTLDSFLPDVVSGNAPLSVNFSSTVSGSTPVGYEWDLDGDATIDSLDDASTSFTYTTPGVYVASLTVTNACGTETQFVTITVCEPLAVSFDSTGTELATACYDFSSTSTGDIAGYSWDLDGDSLEDATGPTANATYASAGSYTVTLTVTGSCGRVESASTTVDVFAAGDCNKDGSVDVADPVSLANYLFGGGATPACLNGCDTNGDGNINLGDVVYSLSYLFSAGPNPVSPAPCTPCL